MKVANTEKPSRIEKLWKDLAEAYSEEAGLDDYSFVDRIDAPEEFRDEYVRLPYDSTPKQNARQW